MNQIFQKIKSIFEPKQTDIPVSTAHNKIRVLTPTGLIAYFFKNVVVIATNERSARRIYEHMLRKEIKLISGEKNEH